CFSACLCGCFHFFFFFLIRPSLLSTLFPYTTLFRSSFRRERESGVLELLLVSPVGEREIIFGRLRGLWGQFLPAFGLLLAIWCYFISIFPGRSDAEPIFFCANTFLTLPVIGLYFSLGCRNFLTAFLSTLATGLLMPVF